MIARLLSVLSVAVAVTLASPATAGIFTFSTGNPNGTIGTLSQPAGVGKLETETADDFILPSETQLTHATFVGLLPVGASLASVTSVQTAFYDVFPSNSTLPPSGNVFTRVNSPSDVAIAARASGAGTLSFTATLLSSSFSVANTVVNGIQKIPNSFTGGEGAATGEEVRFDITFATALDLLTGHYFFVPEVGLTSGEFLWLSAAKPIVGGTPFTPDLQAWIRNSTLSPDWLRIGTDITGQTPVDETFSLSGTSSDIAAVPEPAGWVLLLTGLGALVALSWRRMSPKPRRLGASA